MEIFDDLEAELDRIEAVLAALSLSDWSAPSGAPGWSVMDVVLHLAQTDELVALSAAAPVDDPTWRPVPHGVDDAVDRWVREESSEPAAVFDRWRRARRAALTALRSTAPDARLPWAAAPLKPATLATTRLAEHWAHALDVTQPLGIVYPDVDRLHHVAWLGHSTLPYAFALAGLEPRPVRCELVAPSGAVWTFGPDDAEDGIAGSMGTFCRVGARRLAAEDAGMTTTGPVAATALRLLRNYAA